MARVSWSADESALVAAHFGRWPVRKLAKRLGRSESSVRGHADRLGVRTHAYFAWTMQDVAFLRAHYAVRGAVWVAVQLRRSADAVRSYAGLLGLRRQYAAQGLRPNGTRVWTAAEDAAVIARAAHELPQLARELGRSLKAVEVRRFRLTSRAPSAAHGVAADRRAALAQAGAP